jgi:glyoxylase-like metal-dependent hydrolase (beta-lactamase superfamily II)
MQLCHSPVAISAEINVNIGLMETAGHSRPFRKVAENIYRVKIPLAVPLLDSMNAYVIKDQERNLIVDAGMSQDQCEEAMEAALRELDVDLTKTDFFMTHHHGDHFGLVGRLLADGASILINRTEAGLVERIGSGAIIPDVTHFLEITGFPETDVEKVIPSRAGMEYRARESWPFRFVSDGQAFRKGGHHFRCVTTPGHSTGHTCLYDEKDRILIAGDHLLRNITPAIQLRSDNENPLDDYVKSLDRLYDMDIDLVLPGHGPAFRNCKARIDQIRKHHEQRAGEVLAALAAGNKDAYEVASRIPWSIVDFEGWEGVPLLQKFFATGEAFSHLKYLEEKGRVRKETRGKRIVYSITQN